MSGDYGFPCHGEICYSSNHAARFEKGISVGRTALKQPPARMTVEEFLVWDGDADARYELVGGEVFAMAPPGPGHSKIAFNCGHEIARRLRPPCGGFSEAGIRIPGRDDAYYQADLAVSCTPPAAGSAHVFDPVVIIEILSPSTAAHDRAIKLPDYRRIPSVKEIILISSDAVKAEQWRRSAETWTVIDVEGKDAVLLLSSIGIEILLGAVYEGVAFEADKTG
ncbi:MAG: hypothetical protein A3G18_10020 [Rhodospirillales bacterium RIFCSPLOWO2_12_FULL_58_28]|nr:MAG: hypothetical protein A3H92_08195 [Rhodospirillales bacterium RIFCSPLOWO2_02_FULL_58_16]OHC77617.1 MAG: hypothetical protein A3G18_10020 [Rhodospirillales bacterium RIFCSPLOWO2_12_FULL_58_28]